MVLLVATLLSFFKVHSYESSEEDCWNRFSPQKELVHYFPDHSALYFASGVKLEEDGTLSLVVPIDSNTAPVFHASIAVYELTSKEVVYFKDFTTEREDQEHILRSIPLPKGEYIAMVRHYSSDIAEIPFPSWEPNSKAFYREVTTQPRWKISVKATVLKWLIKATQVFKSELYLKEIDGVKFGAFGNPKARYQVGVVHRELRAVELKEAVKKHCNHESAYCSVSIYKTDGSLLAKIDTGVVIDADLKPFLGEIVVIRTIQS